MINLSPSDIARLKNSAKQAQKIEDKWTSIVSKAISKSASEAVDQLKEYRPLPVPDFETLFIEHYFDVQIAAFRITDSERELDKRLAMAPRTLADIMSLYDRWRKGNWKPKSILRTALEMKNRYIKAVQDEWKKYSEGFRTGSEETQDDIRDKVKAAAKTTVSRAQTIVRTETTRYYNKVRRTYYDRSSDITHYLFLAVRDKATTRWCTSTTIAGKRGRSGLVYAKDDPLLKSETPPCHWNCRSEILPLTPFNPSHRRMIDDESIQRRNHKCYPLPPGWNK